MSSASRTPSPFHSSSIHPTGNVPNTMHPVTTSVSGCGNGIADIYSRKVFVGGLPPDIDEG